MDNRLKYFLGLGWVVAIFLLGYLWAKGEPTDPANGTRVQAAVEAQEEKPEPKITPVASEQRSHDITFSRELEAPSGIAFGEGYKNFPAAIFNDQPAPLRLTDKQKNFRARLNEAYLQPLNFGGSLVLMQFGCGTGCTFAYALDKSSGRVLDFPIGGEDYQAMQLHARKDSALLWVSWYTDAGWDACEAQAWRLGSSGFVAVTPPLSIPCESKEQLASI